MKKMYFLALAAAGLMTACSSDDAVDNGAGSNNTGDETALVPIQIGVTPATITTRGTGTVGDTNEAGKTNAWHGETVNIYMFDQGTLTPAQFRYDSQSQAFDIYDDTEFTTPNDGSASGVAKDSRGQINYYPITGKFDFWGYRIDDATKTEDTKTDNAIIKNITINGTQDIMAGKAALASADESLLGSQSKNYFSAYSARKGVQPTISFGHKLTRFTFVVKAGDESAAGEEDNKGAVKVNKITVKSPVKATFPVAWKEEYTGNTDIEFDATSATDLTLAQYAENGSQDGKTDISKNVATADLSDSWVKQTDSKPDSGAWVNIGEALLVAPNLDAYSMTVNLTQNVKKWEDNKTPEDEKQYQDVTTEFTKDIKLKSGSAFLPGKSYRVIITVYGLQDIKVTTNLEAWDKADDIYIESDSDDTTASESTDTKTEESDTTEGEDGGDQSSQEGGSNPGE